MCVCAHRRFFLELCCAHKAPAERQGGGVAAACPEHLETISSDRRNKHKRTHKQNLEVQFIAAIKRRVFLKFSCVHFRELFLSVYTCRVNCFYRAVFIDYKPSSATDEAFKKSRISRLLSRCWDLGQLACTRASMRACARPCIVCAAGFLFFRVFPLRYSNNKQNLVP